MRKIKVYKKHFRLHPIAFKQSEQLFPHEDGCQAHVAAQRSPCIKRHRCDNENAHEHTKRSFACSAITALLAASR